ncbi:hypothetical protein BS50DRAFT_229677 [Corynespora cassiicola Philippines]|uniref:Uncharacterized protein n=1 Tax=Corynespora cassiicola Philippines TaxID=1448308 RepID=A0A2T2N2B5_CORCC|nr:hypothetical protein BS50DRAFT_229677 [Corynespora cassiicola Philippines]
MCLTLPKSAKIMSTKKSTRRLQRVQRAEAAEAARVAHVAPVADVGGIAELPAEGNMMPQVQNPQAVAHMPQGAADSEVEAEHPLPTTRPQAKLMLRLIRVMRSSLILAANAEEDLLPDYKGEVDMQAYRLRYLIMAQHLAVASLLRLLVHHAGYQDGPAFVTLANTLPAMDATSSTMLKHNLYDVDSLRRVYGQHRAFYQKLKPVQDALDEVVRAIDRAARDEAWEGTDSAEEWAWQQELGSGPGRSLQDMSAEDMYPGYDQKSFPVRLEKVMRGERGE